MSDFIELNARSAFSFLEGASLPEDLIDTCADFGIAAHIGAEVTCTDGNRYPLLAESRTGYQNLCRLITRMKLRAKKGEGAATPEEFAEFAEGLICLAPADDCSRSVETSLDAARTSAYATVKAQ